MDLGIRGRVALVTGGARSLGKADAMTLAAEGCPIAIVDLDGDGAGGAAGEIEAVDEGLEAPIDKAIDIEVRAFLKTLKTEDASEGIQAFFAKREPSFKGK